MIEDELLIAIRNRIADPKFRIDIKTVGTPPLYGVATIRALDGAEAKLGFALPPMLRRLYLEVENGGFGPGAGLLGVEGGHSDADGRTLSDAYLAFRLQEWPEGLLPLCDLGDGAWSCIDERASDEWITTMDHSGPTRTRFSLLSWLDAWVAGVDLTQELFEIEDGIITNPFTKKPTGVKRRGRAKGFD